MGAGGVHVGVVGYDARFEEVGYVEVVLEVHADFVLDLMLEEVGFEDCKFVLGEGMGLVDGA